MASTSILTAAPGATLARITDAPGELTTYYEISDGAHAVQLSAAELDEIALAYLTWRTRGRRSL